LGQGHASTIVMPIRVNLVHVPYRGAAPAVTDVLGGQVQPKLD
jgi:tripartite-type tricarboxylate transporter receptor subunit TctC